MYYFEQLIFEQEQPPLSDEDLDSYSDEDLGEEDLGEEAPPESDSGSLVAIKRYYLIQKLIELNEKLNELRIKNDVLNLIIKFVDSFTYESLLKISNKVAEEIYLYVNNLKKEPVNTTTNT